MEVSVKYDFHLQQDFHISKTTDIQTYFSKIENETPKTDKIRKIGIERYTVYNDLIFWKHDRKLL